MKPTRTRDNATTSDKTNINRIITAQQFGYDVNNKNWKIKDEFRSEK